MTLATRPSDKRPEDADFTAQTNQLGSGTESQTQEITTDVIPPPFASDRINDTVITEQRRQTSDTASETAVISTTESNQPIGNDNDLEKQQQVQSGEDRVDIQTIATQIASLRAKLALQRQTLAKKPRQFLTSVSAVASEEASYLNEWTQKIESTGNRNFPKEALQRKLTGKLRLEVIIHHDGTIREINLKESSGHKLFDESARQTVRQASPFRAFPPEIREKYEQLVIIRTWHFDIKGVSTSP